MKTDNYKYGQKNNWRRWQWNRIEERLKVRKKEAVVLYLAGKEDLDRAEAIRRGFNPTNLIACELENDAVKILRDKGVNVIHGDLIDVLIHWKNPKIDIVIADFCCGLSKKTGQRFFVDNAFWSSGTNSNCVYSVTLLRGRDGDFKPHILYNFLNEYSVGPQQLRKHRGFYAMTLTVVGILKAFLSKENYPADEFEWWMKRLFDPSFFSYKTKNRHTIMDSVVFSTPCELGAPISARDMNYTRKIAAAKAIRTLRL